MSFFDKLFNPRIPHIPPRESAADLKAKEFINQVEASISKHDQVLRSCGLPVPERLTDFSCEVKPQPDEKSFSLDFTLPTFNVPTWLALCLRPAEFCVCVGESKELTCCLSLLDGKHYFLHELIESFSKGDIKVGWTTCDPYKLYLDLTTKKTIGARVQNYDGSGNYRFELNATLCWATNLARARQWTAEEVKDYESRLHTFLRLINGYLNGGKPAMYSGELQGCADLMPDDLWKNLPVADFEPPLNQSTFGFCPDFYPENYLRVKIIPDCRVKPALMRQFFDNLRELRRAIVFSLVAFGNAVSFEIAFAPEDAVLVERQLARHFPGFAVIRQEHREFSDDYENLTCHPEHTYRSLKTPGDFHLDPYNQICEILSRALDSSLEARFEVWCRPFSGAETRAVNRFFEGDYFRRKEFLRRFFPPEDEWLRETDRLFQKKSPAWWMNATIRAIGEYSEAIKIFDGLLGALRQYENPDQRWKETRHREGNLVSLDEIVSLAHFPMTDLNCDRLEVSTMKTKLPPPLYTKGETILGESAARGKTQTVYLPEEVRDRHVYVVGKSGTGKSTLVETIARADIEAGRGAAIIDPHGDMIRHLTEAMPEHRVKDCIYFSPKHSPVSLEILAARTEHEIDLLTDDLVTMFRRTSESWGDKMQAILQMTFQTLLRVPGSSFTDITPLLIDKNYRARMLSKLHHPPLASFWENRFDVRQAEPILIRMDRLTTSNTLRSVLTQHENSLNFYDVIRGGKIFLADLSKGDLGESTSHLLGSIIVSQIQLAAMRQAQLPADERVSFSLFVDEVQNFTTGAFSTILSEARKYKLRLTLAHQFVSQLPPDIQKAIFGNVGTMLFFSMSPDDLGAARHELGTYEPADVANLPQYAALCRPSTAARDTFSFTTLPPSEIPKETAEEKRAMILDAMRNQFAPPEPQEPPPVASAKTEPSVLPKSEEVKAATPTPEKTATAPPISRSPQKIETGEDAAQPEGGNRQHRYLQSLVKRIAEREGFVATEEHEVFGGIGRIDVALEDDSLKIACEIAVTNTADYEIQNLRKCLAAGFDKVAVISSDTKHLHGIKRKAETTIAAEQLAKVHFLEPEHFHLFLESVRSQSAGRAESKVKGYRINARYRAADEKEQAAKQQTLAGILKEAIRREK